MRWMFRITASNKNQKLANHRLLRSLDRWFDLPFEDTGSKKYYTNMEQYYRDSRVGRMVYNRLLKKHGVKLEKYYNRKVGVRRGSFV